MTGRLRASHRKLHEPPYDNLGLPWHRGAREDLMPLKADEPTELAFDLYPISYVFRAGHRIRVTLAFAQPDASAPPAVSVLRDADHPSRLVLPVIPAEP
jgi:uncharacterized protein